MCSLLDFLLLQTRFLFITQYCPPPLPVPKRYNSITMPIEKNILIAFILNLAFSLFEFFGGLFTNSVAILSDSIHDLGDAISIGLSYFLERKSQKKPDQHYTFGYRRYSIIGGAITTSILIVGSLIVIYQAIGRIIHPVAINYDGMLLFAIFGVIVNFFAAYFTREGNSLNQKAVNLHMLEDVLGWVVVLLGAVIMRFTSWSILDLPFCPLAWLFLFSFMRSKTSKKSLICFWKKRHQMLILIS